MYFPLKILQCLPLSESKLLLSHLCLCASQLLSPHLPPTTSLQGREDAKEHQSPASAMAGLYRSVRLEEGPVHTYGCDVRALQWLEWEMK